MTINLELLLQQKQALLRAMDRSDADADLLQGVLNVLDYIHDQLDPPISYVRS